MISRATAIQVNSDFVNRTRYCYILRWAIRLNVRANMLILQVFYSVLILHSRKLKKKKLTEGKNIYLRGLEGTLALHCREKFSWDL